MYTNMTCEKWAPLLLPLPNGRRRTAGRPPLQWLDDLKQFRDMIGEGSLEDILRREDLEKRYVEHSMNKIA